MSTFEFTDDTEWGGRPVARRLAGAMLRARLVASATIGDAWTDKHPTGVTYTVLLDDGSASLEVMFFGREVVGGLLPGVRVTIEGVVGSEHGKLVVWNPKYRIEEPPAEQR